ncbi:hypothetical protein A5724_17030 [Mycobacterium sp. ACS1612]|uniref:tripartite tricarboxylate transporter TctB family protein n=1 Tax=Mycobacterium sp. ACS1612 TaxID=1834117 RepID=UPI0007FD2C63|nr:tripartite tricarboxylate transporter TctB family protein [Mycobacterium sp. ACS1612]OBF34251.1 hypothetical protein A5724_17030 [Mycobacterium sp. ACS1612]
MTQTNSGVESPPADSPPEEHDPPESERSVLATAPLAQAALGLAATAVGVVAFINASGLPMFGKHGVPGPGMFPTALSVAVLGLGLALVATSIVRRIRQGPAPAGQLAGVGRQFLRAGSVWLGLTVSIPLMNLFGFVPATILLIAYLILVIERIRSMKAVLVIVLVPVLAYALFVLVLGVELPTSALFEGN